MYGLLLRIRLLSGNVVELHNKPSYEETMIFAKDTYPQFVIAFVSLFLKSLSRPTTPKAPVGRIDPVFNAS
jgi:hypothetical protein